MVSVPILLCEKQSKHQENCHCKPFSVLAHDVNIKIFKNVDLLIDNRLHIPKENGKFLMENLLFLPKICLT